MTLDTFNTITTIMAGICTLAIFSFLIKENVFYRFFEHIFIGISTAIFVVLTLRNYIWPSVIVPLFGLDIVTFPDGTVSKEFDKGSLLLIIPICIGLLYYFIYSKKHSWLSKIAIGISLGASGGLAFKGFANQALPQVTSSFKPLVVKAKEGINYFQSFENIVFVITLLSVMYYFFFTIRQDGKGAKCISKTGRYLMMVCFGAFFGSTVMARIALLVERLNFLFNDWYQAILSLF